MTMSRRPATAAEIAAAAQLPAHRQVVEVETNDDGRATVGRATTIHRAIITTDLNARGERLGSLVQVGCGAERYRGSRSRATATSNRYDVGCTRCLAG